MTNGTGGPNLYTIDSCSVVRTILKISTEGTGILIILQCFFFWCSVGTTGQQSSFGHDIFFFFLRRRCVAPRRVAGVKSLSLSCIYSILDSKRFRPRKWIRPLPLQPKTHFGYIHTRAGAPGTTRLSVTNGTSVIREMMP